MKKLLKYLKGYRKEAILGPFFKLIEAALELLVPLIIALIINKGINEGLGTAYILRMCLYLVLLATLGLAFSLTAQYFSAKAAVNFSGIIREKLFEKIQSLSYQEFDEIGTSSLITIMTSDCNQVQNGLNLFLRLFLRSPFAIIGALVMAFIVNVKAAIIFSIVIPVLLVVIILIMVITKNKYKVVQAKLDNVVLKVRENLVGSRVIRAFGKEDNEIKEYDKCLKVLNKKQKNASILSTFLNPFTYVIMNLGIIFVIYVASKQVNSGIILQGDVVALYNYMSQILVELIKLANLIITLAKALASANRISKVLELKSSLKYDKYYINQNKDQNNDSFINLNNVSFSYLNSGLVLSNISFSVKKGSTVGIIGGTGSGKTTLVNLISHFYDPTEGEIYLEGKNINTIDPIILHERIGIVPQKAVLFKGTIRDNIKWGKNNATDEEILKAIEISQASEVISKKEKGLDSIVSQNGANFSGGQRQRLTIARAIVGNPDIIILDDSASALDFLTDYNLRKALKTLANNPTTFIVSQRTSSIQNCDQIIVLDDGRLVGVGTHDELLDNCKVYLEIYNSQFKKRDEKND